MCVYYTLLKTIRIHRENSLLIDIERYRTKSGDATNRKSWKLWKKIDYLRSMATVSEWLDSTENPWLDPMPYLSCWSAGRCSHHLEVTAPFSYLSLLLLPFFYLTSINHLPFLFLHPAQAPPADDHESEHTHPRLQRRQSEIQRGFHLSTTVTVRTHLILLAD